MISQRGIGARLLAHAESWLRAREAVTSIVNSSTHRVDAHRFYRREGYQAIGWRFQKGLPQPGLYPATG
jgi:PhnO protein